MIEVFHSNDGGYYADTKEEDKDMSLVSRSYEDPVEIVKEKEEMTETSEQIYISPRYKGKNPKSPEQLKAEREEKKLRKARHYISTDPAVNPSHYKTKNGVEAIELIEAFTEDLPGYEAYLAGTAMKYLCRYKKKNGLQDILKAAWYVDELATYLKTGEKHD